MPTEGESNVNGDSSSNASPDKNLLADHIRDMMLRGEDADDSDNMRLRERVKSSQVGQGSHDPVQNQEVLAEESHKDMETLIKQTTIADTFLSGLVEQVTNATSHFKYALEDGITKAKFVQREIHVENEALRKQVTELTELRDQNQSSISMLEEQNSLLEAAFNRLESETSQRVRDAELQAADSVAAWKKAYEDSVERGNSELVSVMTQAIQEKEAAVSPLKEKILAMTAEINRLTTELKEQRAANTSLVDEHTIHVANIEESHAVELKEATGKIQKLEAQLSEFESRILRHGDTVADLQTKLAEERARNEMAEAELDKITADRRAILMKKSQDPDEVNGSMRQLKEEAIPLNKSGMSSATRVLAMVERAEEIAKHRPHDLAARFKQAMVTIRKEIVAVCGEQTERRWTVTQENLMAIPKQTLNQIARSIEEIVVMYEYMSEANRSDTIILEIVENSDILIRLLKVARRGSGGTTSATSSQNPTSRPPKTPQAAVSPTSSSHNQPAKGLSQSNWALTTTRQRSVSPTAHMSPEEKLAITAAAAARGVRSARSSDRSPRASAPRARSANPDSDRGMAVRSARVVNERILGQALDSTVGRYRMSPSPVPSDDGGTAFHDNTKSGIAKPVAIRHGGGQKGIIIPTQGNIASSGLRRGAGPARSARSSPLDFSKAR